LCDLVMFGEAVGEHTQPSSGEQARMRVVAALYQQVMLAAFVSERAQMFKKARMRLGARRWSKMRRKLRRKFPDIIGPGDGR
jgi:hypothetical protein